MHVEKVQQHRCTITDPYTRRPLTHISDTNVSTIVHNKYISAHTTVYTDTVILHTTYQCNIIEQYCTAYMGLVWQLGNQEQNHQT